MRPCCVLTITDRVNDLTELEVSHPDSLPEAQDADEARDIVDDTPAPVAETSPLTPPVPT